MAFRFKFLTIFLLIATEIVLSTKQSGSARPQKRPDPPTLSENIVENPFLKDHFTTSASIPAVDYVRNPFLSASNGNQGHFNTGIQDQEISAESTEDSGDVTVAIYVHNPFLQSPCNTPGCNTTVTTVKSTKNSNIGTDNVDVVKLPVISDSTRTKSEIKCEEYSRQIFGTTEVLPLVGGNPDVIKIDNSRCRGINHLVVGGTDAKPGEFPHMVALGKNISGGSFMFYCGGTLISHGWVLSAAHCTYGPNGSPTVVRVGFYSLKEEPHTSVGISRILRHPAYRPPAMYADIALIKLETVVRFSNTIRPACLYQQYDTVPTQAWVSGWGVTEYGGDQSDKLQKAYLDVIDNIACTLMYKKSTSVPYGITPSMICAGDPQGGWNKDTCQGDSGGPLQIIHPRNLCLFQVVGVTSFGEGCAIVNKPGVYTKVSHYLDWIEDIVWSGS